MKTIKTLIGLLVLSFCLNSTAATRYVSDEVVIYTHSGPSLEYRIIGTLKVGEKVNTLEYDEDTQFMQVKTAKGKIVWVKNSELQQALPAKTLLPRVKQQLKDVQAELAKTKAKNSKTLQEKSLSMDEKEILIKNLEDEKRTLQLTIEDLKARNQELDLLQDTKDERIKMEWLMYGGSVLFFGLLLGLIIPFLPRRKKRQNNW